MPIETVAEASVELFGSVTTKPESMATGVEVVLSPATNAVDPESMVTTGITAVTSIV